MEHNRSADLRRWWKRVIAPVMLALVVACSPLYSEGGCDPPQATDAGSPTISLDQGSEGVRGTDPHLIIGFDCPGESNTFLAAIKVDGALRSMHEVQCAGFGSHVTHDAGHWEPPDTVWHSVEVILDPLNLFKETSESNNRGSAMLRIVEPNGTTPAVSGPASRGRR